MGQGKRLAAMVLMAVLVGGCASAGSGTFEPAGISYRDDQDLQRVWLADGVDFRAYDTILVGETQVDVAKLDPDGKEMLEWARGYLREEIVSALRAKNVAAIITTNQADIRSGARVLRLENTIVEYEKGGGGARFFAGLYGAGQPVIRVRGRLTDGSKPVLLYIARRSGDTGLARAFGGYRSDRAIQEEDIKDLAVDLADFVARNGRPR